ncbi:hypothetical protein [Neptuniibacter halophilus]|uniref:hypothetical protein n=1 Tax=Neptuniibacter halophilus TaxID=651666 RepID=UPI002573E4F0|nr:hypothetical protein [Neptuniibacter halophilus]
MIISTPLLVLLLVSGCSSNPSAEPSGQPASDQDSYCLNGGRNQQYSCDPALASQQPDMRPGEVDEDWMYRTLGEIKQWINQLKQEAGGSSPAP